MSQDTGNPGVTETSSEDIAAPNPRYVRILLITVILLGFLLAGGAAVVISTVIARLSAPEGPMARDFELSEIVIPAGARLVEVGNGATRIVLHLEDKGGPLLVLLDPRKGKETGRVRLIEEK